MTTSLAPGRHPIPEGWVALRDPASQKLLAVYDPQRGIIELLCSYWDKEQRERKKYRVKIDLTEYPRPASGAASAPVVVLTPPLPAILP